MPSPYNDVELTDSDKQSIYDNPELPGGDNPQEKGIGQETGFGDQTHDTDTPKETEAKAEVETEGETEVSESDEFNLEDYEVEIDGEVYDEINRLN